MLNGLWYIIFRCSLCGSGIHILVACHILVQASKFCYRILNFSSNLAQRVLFLCRECVWMIFDTRFSSTDFLLQVLFLSKVKVVERVLEVLVGPDPEQNGLSPYSAVLH